MSKRERISLRKWKFKRDEGITVQETKFADFYSDNPIGKEAAIRAGIPESIALKWANQTLRKVAVKKRIEQNLEEIRSCTIMQARERREILTRIGRASVEDALELDSNGEPVSLNIYKAKKRGRAVAINSIAIEDSVDGRGGAKKSRSIKMLSPIQAIDTLNKMDHIYDRKLKEGGSLVLIPVEDMEGL